MAIEATPFRFDHQAGVASVSSPSKVILNRDKLLEMAQYVFGEDRVMRLYTTSSTSGLQTISLFIHFPEINMTNSKNEKHTIKHIFVRLRISELKQGDSNNMTKCLVEMDGARTEYSLPEIRSCYCHSHLTPGVSFPGSRSGSGWATFCLGSSDISMVKSNTQIHAEEEDWMSLFFSIEHYLAWESLEGGPYIKIRDINSGSSSSLVNNSALETELDRIYNKIPFHLWEYSPEGFTINPFNPEVIDFFNEHSSIRKLKITRSIEDRRQEYMGQHGHKVFRFLDHDFKFTITPSIEEKKEEDPTKEPVESVIITKYCTSLETRITEFTKKYLHASITQGKDLTRQVRVLEQA